ncbi:MAG: hypothetical protein K8H85_18345 [Cyclobacteriaceae bacterium]|nr:hypothetical protein [Cyclobacteriaceae bacterium]
MKIYILGVVIVASLFGCESKEKLALQHKVDSLNVELVAIKEVERGFKEVGVLIDSIDASRKSLQVKMIEGNNYADYVSRLRGINLYIKKTEAKLRTLETSNKNSSKTAASSIRRLRADLENRTQEVVALQLQIATLNKSNMALWTKVHEKDSLLFMKDLVIKLKESDIANLSRMNVEVRESNQVTVANLYFEQAAALEEAANRTQFAPNKKKATRREALELYKLSLSLGNHNAQARIDDLEKKLS